eukprot:1273183-Prymnesium_polylepis.1
MAGAHALMSLVADSDVCMGAEAEAILTEYFQRAHEQVTCHMRRGSRALLSDERLGMRDEG